MGEEAQRNLAVWLKSFSSPPELINLPVPEAGPGSAVIRVLSTWLPQYAAQIHDGTIGVFNLHLPLVPNPSNVGRVHSVGPDAVKLKVGDLVYYNPWIKGRDNPDINIIQGHHGGEGLEGAKLMQGEWRDGSMQQYQKVPLERVFVLNEKQLCGKLGYQPAELQELALHTAVVGTLLEAARLQAGETIIIGPATGTFGPATVDLALVLGANVIALGRSKEKLDQLWEQTGSSDRLKLVVMTGNEEADTASILEATPNSAGAEVFNDWTSGMLETPPYFAAAFKTLKREGRVVLSGAPSGNVSFPYAYAMHKNLKITGKVMVEREGIEATIRMVESGLLKIGKLAGAKTAFFPLEKHEEAIEHAGKHGGYKNYTFIAPNES
jgi:NADPH:quinone reductase-like Zn-dependent oxidoreductase